MPSTQRSPRRPVEPRASPRRRGGFIIFHGWTTITTREFRRAERTTCPQCRVEHARLVGRVRRRWFAFMFIPIFPLDPVDHGYRTTKCLECKTLFDFPIDQLVRTGRSLRKNTLADTFALYNDLRDHPTDGQRMLRLLEMYEAADEPGEAESAARHFPAAMAAEPRCAEVLERMRIAQ